VKEAKGERPVTTDVLADLERKRLIRRGTGEIPRKILERDPPGCPAGVLEALLGERRPG
jgi:hypothetical protein